MLLCYERMKSETEAISLTRHPGLVQWLATVTECLSFIQCSEWISL